MSQQPPKQTSDNRHQPAIVKDNNRLSNDLRIAYQQIYDIHDAHQETVKQLQQARAELENLKQRFAGPYPPGNGPLDSVLVGLPVQPIDASALADGATLKFSKKTGNFVVS